MLRVSQTIGGYAISEFRAKIFRGRNPCRDFNTIVAQFNLSLRGWIFPSNG